MRNSKLREANVSVPVPYIESVDFESEGVQPLYLTVRDSKQGTYFLDISNKSRLAVVDLWGAGMVLDSQGVYFSTNGCRYDVNVTIDSMFTQLANLSNVDCSFGRETPPVLEPPTKRSEDIQFNQTLFLRDQCGSPVSKAIREYPQLLVGDTACPEVAVNAKTGRWDFDCTFPGTFSGAIQCQTSVQNDIIDFLTRDPFGGACPDLPTAISTLASTAGDVLNADSLREELYNQSDGEDYRSGVDVAVAEYELLWTSLQEFFHIPNEAVKSPWEKYISTYNSERDFIDDICEDLHAGEIPISLTLIAGATTIPEITTLNWAPRSAVAHNITVQDPEAIACCPGGGVAENQGDESCAYPATAFVAGTTCICGKTVGGRSLAFEATECGNFEGVCKGDADCGGGFVCVTGTCCGGGVCVDPYACSQNGTALVKFGSGL